MTDVPRPFKGTKAQREKNFLSHDWRAMDDEIHCRTCGTEAHHVAASYPCGTEPPRMEVGEDLAKSKPKSRPRKRTEKRLSDEDITALATEGERLQELSEEVSRSGDVLTAEEIEALPDNVTQLKENADDPASGG
jgi:hypothetical protein